MVDSDLDQQRTATTAVVVVDETAPVVAGPHGARAFYPEPLHELTAERARVLMVREELLLILRRERTGGKSILADFVDAVLEKDTTLPTGFISACSILINRGRAAKLRRERREQIRRALDLILERLFDPTQPTYALTMKDVRDAFESQGMDRDAISIGQIRQVYVRIEQALTSGPIRELVHQEHLYSYIDARIQAIKASRVDFETKW